MSIIPLLFMLLLLGGAVAGVIALRSVGSLREEVRALRGHVDRLRGAPPAQATPPLPRDDSTELRPREDSPPPAQATPASPPPRDDSAELRPREDSPPPAADAWSAAGQTEASGRRAHHAAWHHLRENWMIWLGGLCVALAGIFLVHYSIEQGLLGPAARFAAGLVTGAALHIAAEWLRRRTGETHPALAALAGAGSIILFASLLAGLRLYDLIAPGTAFVLMALVALITMAMSYIHGPVLAAFGILGAYLVPLLVTSGAGQVIVALVYALIISGSALLLLRYVFRPWLWWGFLAGAFAWWLITVFDTRADAFRPIYLLVLAYFIVAIPHFDWLLKKRLALDEESWDLRRLFRVGDYIESRLVIVFLGLSLASFITLFVQRGEYIWLVGLPLLLFSFAVSRSREQLYWLPWLLLLAQCAAWLLIRWQPGETGWRLELLTGEEAGPFLAYLLVTALLVSAGALWNWNACRFKAVWGSLATLGPFVLLTLGYLLTSRLVESWFWGLGTALPALAYMIIATGVRKKPGTDSIVVWLFVAGHYGLALAAAMVFNEASLTLVLALQIVSLAWLIRTFDAPALAWLVKLVVAVVIVRLTFNPWLATYPPEIHWPLWSYGGATLCAVLGTVLLRGHREAARWTEAAALHLFVLTVFAELRYQLYDGQVFAPEYTFVEATIYLSLLSVLGLLYYRRSLTSELLGPVYLAFSGVMTALAVLDYLVIGAYTAASNPWVYTEIGGRPIFNLLLATYLAPVLWGLLYYFFHVPAGRRAAAAFVGVAGFVFVSLEVRHLWTGGVRLDEPAIGSGELYTYSAVWLVIAIAALLAGSWRLGRDCYRAGMVLLAIVIVKLFLVDMSGLEGLLRVASFMGLGLSLLGISYIHQRLGALSRL